jgi:hypothetical protein
MVAGQPAKVETKYLLGSLGVVELAPGMALDEVVGGARRSEAAARRCVALGYEETPLAKVRSC